MNSYVSQWRELSARTLGIAGDDPWLMGLRHLAVSLPQRLRPLETRRARASMSAPEAR